MIRLQLVNKLFSVKWIQNGTSCGVTPISTAAFPLQFQTSPALWGEPLKKKVKLDPAIIKAREERKKKKIEKRIRQLQKLERFFKPVFELQTPRPLLDNPENRRRTIESSPEEQEERIILLKEWTRKREKERKHDKQLLSRLECSQQNALQQLRLESEELYQAAVKIDSNLIPFIYKGPVETPSKEDYPLPDGEYIDMDENNKHTSVVIKFPEEEKADDLKACKLDLEDEEASKGYVIDQLFSNDEIAVYAMFEVSTFDIENKKNLKKLSCSNFGEFRFPQRRTYAEKEEQNTRLGKAMLIDSKEEPAAFLQLESEKNDREENPSGVEKTKKHIKLKSTSKGVNTDIDQSPRLLEEVQRAISMNFSEFSEKTMELSSFASEKSSQDLREMITAMNSTAFNLEGKNGKHGEKSFPNIVMVPIILKNEDLHNFLKDENSQEPPNLNQILDSKTSVVLHKVSVSTSTELSLVQHKNNEEPETLQNKPHINEKANERNENGKSQEYLLEEIKNLQEQFNTLLISLKSIGFNFSKKIETKDITTEPEEPKPVCKTLNKFDDIPIFSREICVLSEPKNCNGKTVDVEVKKEEPPIASKSKSFTKGHIGNKNVIDECGVKWKEFQSQKELQKSKSQTNVMESKNVNSNLKKCFSMDLGREPLRSKKLENAFLKFEGRIKKKNKSIRINEDLIDKRNEFKLQDSSKFESAEVKSANDFKNKAVVSGLLKMQKNQLIKDLEKELTEKTASGRMHTRTSNADPGDKAKKPGLRSKITEIVKLETKAIPPQEKKQNLKFIRRVSVNDSAQSKLHVNLLIKSQQNCEQKKNSSVKFNSTRLPRANFQKKDESVTKKDKNPEAEPINETKVPVKENENEAEISEDKHPETSMVVLELFSKKPPSVEDLNSEVDLQCQYGNNADAEENCGSGKNDNSNSCQTAIVKSVWALKKFFLYEDGKKKMEVLEASPNPPDYCLNQNSTEDKIR